jgi:hypothetical protein
MGPHVTLRIPRPTSIDIDDRIPSSRPVGWVRGLKLLVVGQPIKGNTDMRWDHFQPRSA